MHRSLASLLLASLPLLAACERGATPAQAPDSTARDAHGAESHGAESHAAAGEGQALRPIMQRLGGEMTALTHALMTEDHATVSRSAAAIAAHAPISAAELERIRAALGPDMAAFAAVDDSVHVAATRLHDAARARRLALVAERLGEVQRGCVSCHARFRARLRTDAGGR